MKNFNSVMIVVIITYLIGCSADPVNVSNDNKKLDYYLESYVSTNNSVQVGSKVQYEYNESGKLEKYRIYTFNPNSNTFNEERYFVLTYNNDEVKGMNGFLVNEPSPYIEYTYQYTPNGNISVINELNHSAGVNSQASFTYFTIDNAVQVAFTFSNGQGFEYAFNYGGKNILSDKTTKGSEICSNGSYTYDEKKNPFSKLGYYDYTFNTLSINNRLTENVNYLNCVFPSLIPVSYSYEYDNDGFPVKSTTNYSTNTYKQTREFFYR